MNKASPYTFNLDDFAFVFPQVVAWGDMDALGHVNNVVYHRYTESARIAYLYKLGMFSDSFLVLAKSSCTYMRPVHFPDTLQIGIRCTKMGTTSMVFEYVFFSEVQQAIVAVSDSVVVQMDEHGHKKQAWSDEQRAKIEQFENN